MWKRSPFNKQPSIKLCPLFQNATHVPETRYQLQEWQIDVPWPEDDGAPWELLKWFAEVVQRAIAPDKRPMQKQK